MPTKNARSIQKEVISRTVALMGSDEFDESSKLRSVATRIALESRGGITTISRDTVIRWYTIWIDHKMLPLDLPGRWKRVTSAIWSKQALQSLKDIIDECPILYLDEIVLKLKERCGQRFRPSAISWALRKRLNYSRKSVYEKASQQVALDKEMFQETLKIFTATPEMLIFVDESNKDRVAARRKYGWSPVGTPVNYRALFNMDNRYTFIGAADCFGFVPPACDIVTHKYKEKDEHKPVDTDRFVEYVDFVLCPSLGNFSRAEPHSIVVMDNCSIHMDPRVKELIESRGAIIIYSAPYSPEIIPIEFMFSKWKSYLKRYNDSFSHDWYTVHMAAIASVTPQMGLNIFKKSGLVEMAERHPLSTECKESLEEVAIVCMILDELDD